jgi:hypothetical protein
MYHEFSVAIQDDTSNFLGFERFTKNFDQFFCNDTTHMKIRIHMKYKLSGGQIYNEEKITDMT